MQPGAWLQVTLPWICPVPTCRRPWPEPTFLQLTYHNPETGHEIARVRVHWWTYECGHVQLIGDVLDLAAQWEREQGVVKR